jgi:PAS domain S-box-containing protein
LRQKRRQYLDYIIALSVMAAALAVHWPLYPLLGGSRPYLTLFGGVALAVWFARWKPATLAAIFGFLIANYFLVAPQHALVLNTLFFEFFGFALSAGLIIFFGETMHRARERAERELAERKQAEESERRQKELLRVTLGSIGDGVIVADAAGRVRSLNAEAERLTGWSEAEAAGQPLAEVFRIVNEETGQPVENPVDKVLRLGAVAGMANHTALVSKAGVRTPIGDSAAPIREPGGLLSGVVLVFRDVSEERAAQRASAQLAAIVEFSGDAIVTKDLGGIIQTWNESAERLLDTGPTRSSARRSHV